jgi:hypothetical protein
MKPILLLALLCLFLLGIKTLGYLDPPLPPIETIR